MKTRGWEPDCQISLLMSPTEKKFFVELLSKTAYASNEIWTYRITKRTFLFLHICLSTWMTFLRELFLISLIHECVVIFKERKLTLYVSLFFFLNVSLTFQCQVWNFVLCILWAFGNIPSFKCVRYNYTVHHVVKVKFSQSQHTCVELIGFSVYWPN